MKYVPGGRAQATVSLHPAISPDFTSGNSHAFKSGWPDKRIRAYCLGLARLNIQSRFRYADKVWYRELDLDFPARVPAANARALQLLGSMHDRYISSNPRFDS